MNAADIALTQVAALPGLLEQPGNTPMASIELVEQPDENGGYLLSRLRRVHAMCERNENYIWTDQYANAANPLIHAQTTGPEIYAQMQGKVDALFIAVSTGGTLAGVSRFFRAVSPATRVVGVDAHGSVIFGTPAAPRKLTGIGSSRKSSFLTREVLKPFERNDSKQC